MSFKMIYSAIVILCTAGIALCEFQVNTYVTNAQVDPAVACDSEGNFVIVWASNYQDGDYDGVYGQRFDNYGRRIGSEFRINEVVVSDQDSPDIAMAADGTFVVTWEGSDGNYEGIFARKFDSTANPITCEFQVNTYTDSRQLSPKIAMNDNGNFIIVWEGFHGNSDWRIHGQSYNSNAVRIGSEFTVNQISNTTGPKVSMFQDGSFVVIWTGQSPLNIKMRRYNSDATPQTDEYFMANNLSGYRYPQIAVNRNGEYVIAWINYDTENGNDILVQKFENDLPICEPFKVKDSDLIWNDYQRLNSIDIDDRGYFVVSWYTDVSGRNDGSSYSIQYSLYDPNCLTIKRDVRLNGYTSGAQARPDVKILKSGRFVATWHSKNQDGSDYGIYAKFAPETFNADFNHDGFVGTEDFIMFADCWLTNEPVFDIWPDGILNFSDFTVFAEQWLNGVE